VAVLGHRGIPPHYGGFDSVAWNLAKHLPQRGFQLYIFSERSYRSSKPSIPGVRLVYLPVLERMRILSEVVYDILGLTWCSFRPDVKVVYLLGYSAAPFCIIPRIFGKKVVVNVDGLEWKRRKFGPVIRQMLHVLERLTHYVSDYLVFDSREIQAFHEREYGGHASLFLPQCISEYDFATETSNYYLAVARFEPENNLNMIIEGFQRSGSKNELWLVGTSSNRKYNNELKTLARVPQVRFLGPIYGEKLGQLRRKCFAYVHGHEVGGTNPSLLEALSYGNPVLAMDVPFNREVAGSAGLYFRNAETLAKLVDLLEANPGLREKMRITAFENAHNYDRDKIMGDYERAFRSMGRELITD